MSFPPNLGITNSFIIDSNSPLLFQGFPSLIPPLHQISSPFSKMNGYSRITKPTSTRSKSIDFSDLSFPRSTANSKPNLKITTANSTILENEHGDGLGEVFGVILSRKCPIPPVPSDQKMLSDPESSSSMFQNFVRKSLPIKRSVSVSEGYSRIHHQSDLNTEYDDLNGTEVSSQQRSVKKKGKFFKACKRLFGL